MTRLIALQHLWLILQVQTGPPLPPVSSTSQSLTPAPIACKGEIVSRIDVHRRPPFEVSGSSIWKRALRWGARQHVTTKEKIIRRYLALQVGDHCTELRRTDSERILRVQPFLADADVLAYPDGNGGVVLDVSTVDEASLILDGVGSAHNPHIRGVRVGDGNLLGDATYVVGKWGHGEIFRDSYWGKISDYQFLDKPYQLALWGGRQELGGTWATEASHPFYTDLQRLSWRVTAGSDAGYFMYLRPDTDPAAVRLNRNYADIGGVVRIGRPGSRLGLVGGSISHEAEDPGESPFVITDAGLVADTSTALINRFRHRRSTRINALWGVRDVQFVRVTGFDALEGTQDVRTGLQLSTLLGKGIKGLHGQDDDLFTSSDIYGGIGTRWSFAAFDLSAEGRRARLSNWDGVLAHGRSAVYLKPLSRHTVMTDFTWSAGWKQRVPFQLTLSDPEGGIRGFSNSEIGGARRMVGRFEDRYLVGRISNVASIGLGGFVDAGKIWAGDAPLGLNSPLSIGAGFSLLAAVPPRSQRMWRADIAFPVRGGKNHRVELRFSNSDFTRIFRREPGDVYSSRERSVPSSVFNWP